jgi:hypothetical protein
MVVQGANDVCVVQAESDQIVEALRARGVDVEYLVFPDLPRGSVNSALVDFIQPCWPPPGG